MADSISEALMYELKEAFDLFDKNGDGYIPAKELGPLITSLGDNPIESALQDMFNEIGTDENGTIDFPEFLNLVLRKPEAPDHDEEIKKVLAQFADEDGFISVDELRHVLTNIGEKLSDEEVDEMIEAAGGGGCDGRIKYEELVKIMLAK